MAKSVTLENLSTDEIKVHATNWKKRSYEFGIFYQPHNKAGGISFNLFGFE